MTVLALDIATTTGYAMLKPDGRVEHGAKNFGLRKHDKSGQRWVNFRLWLHAVHEQQQIKAVHFEDCVILSGAGQTNVARIYGGFVATLEAYCEMRQIPYSMVSIGTWKKHFTGNGAAKKEQIIQVCRQLGFKPEDDNAADALGILHYATGRCPILTPSTPAPKVKRPSKPRSISGDPDKPF